MKNIIIRFTSIILIFILLSCFLSNFIKNESHAAEVSEDINSLDDSKYPGIKSMIQSLQSQYPNWNFKIFYTGLNWNDVISGEYKGHGASPTNLVPYTNNYKGAWICPICGEEKPYDNGTWRCASEQAIAYMMDPRNSLNVSDIFQFEELSNVDSNIDSIKSMTTGSFLEGHEQGIIDTANECNVNPYYIVARVIQEQGRQGSDLVSGESGYYNAFNIGASGNGKEQIVQNGIAYAQKKGWTTLELSIKGGIEFVADNYINQGQNTLYLQKFNVTPISTYTHQYQQNIMAAQSEGSTLREAYKSIGALSNSHTFIIPVYENMPETAAARPDGSTGATVNSDLVKVNVNNSLRMRNEPNGSETVGWIYKDEIVTRVEKATTKVAGTYWDKIMKADGTTGYTARETYDGETPYKLYLVPVNSDSGNTGNDGTTDNPSDIGSNDPTLKNGDVNKDGNITASDYVLIKNSIMGTITLDEQARKAADVNKDGNITASDYVLVKNYIMGIINSL